MLPLPPKRGGFFFQPDRLSLTPCPPPFTILLRWSPRFDRFFYLDREVENMVHESSEVDACAVRHLKSKVSRQVQFFESRGRGGVKICCARHRVSRGDCLPGSSSIGISAEGSQGFWEGRRHGQRVYRYLGQRRSSKREIHHQLLWHVAKAQTSVEGILEKEDCYG